jgi:hypothetical protein
MSQEAVTVEWNGQRYPARVNSYGVAIVTGRPIEPWYEQGKRVSAAIARNRGSAADEHERAVPIEEPLFVARVSSSEPCGGCIICGRWPQRDAGDIEMFVPNTSPEDDRFVCHECAFSADPDLLHRLREQFETGGPSGEPGNN